MSDQKRWRDVTVDDAFAADPRDWLAQQAGEGMPWLLAHADDGVIWGKCQPDGSFKLSSDVFDDPQKYPAVAVELDARTLQQVRVFGPSGELLVWRTGDGFAARIIADGPEPPPEDQALPDEQHLLWGVGRVVESRGGFSLVQEGKQGPRHAPPVEGTSIRNTGRLALVVRHYLDYDGEDQAYVSLSRLVKLEP